MGGPGSGRWKDHMKRPTVEECRSILDVKTLRNQGVFDESAYSGVIREGLTTIRLWSTRKSETHFHLTINSGPCLMEQNIDVIKIDHPWGHRIIRFLCPCGMSLQKLYLPVEESLFRCRNCHHLAYRSSQTAHEHDSLFRRYGIGAKEAKMIRNTGMAESVVRMLTFARMLGIKGD